MTTIIPFIASLAFQDRAIFGYRLITCVLLSDLVGCGDCSLRPLQQQGRELIGHVEHHIMPACKLLLPPAALSCLGVKLAERTVIAPRQNVSDVCDAVAGAADLRRRFKTGQRMHCALTVHPGGVCRIDREERRRSWRDSPAIAIDCAHHVPDTV